MREILNYKLYPVSQPDKLINVLFATVQINDPPYYRGFFGYSGIKGVKCEVEVLDWAGNYFQQKISDFF